MKARIIFVLLFGLLIAGSCDLQEQPYGFYSADNFYKTPNDARSSLLYAYDALTYLEYSRTVFYLGDLPTDEVSPKSDEGADAQQLSNWKVNSFKTNHLLENFFHYAYIAINRANAVIKHVPDAKFDQADKDKFVGEAYFLRAFNYFNLVRNFGKVPMHKSVVQTLDETTAPPAKNLDEVYSLIISDCKEAIKRLKIDPMLGRTDKVAAQSLLAKVYLTIASAKEHNVPLYKDMSEDVNKMYDKSAQYARDVVEKQSQYHFDDNLLHIYDVDSPHAPENIFLMSMDRSGESEGDYSKIGKLFIPYVDGATLYLSDHDGTFTKTHDGWSVLQTNTPFYNSFGSSDKRKTQLMVDTVYTADGNVSATYPGSILYPFSRKYVDPHFIGDKESTKPFLIRYSDIALVLAEAVGPTQEGYKQVNYIRNRAGLGNLQPNMSKADFRKAVLRERKWELAFEGNRLYDLKRFNMVTDMVPEASSLSDKQVAFYPIPQTEIDLNQGLQ